MIKKKITKLKRNIRKAPLSSYVTLSIALIIIYTAVVTILTALTDADYSTLYTVFCGIFGGEILSCAIIKIFKLRGEEQ